MKEYYECHITFMWPKGKYHQTKGWVFSQIDGDPVLGEGVKSYLTKQYSISWPLKEIVEALGDICNELRLKYGITPLREKVERVVYDTKTLPKGLLQE